MRNILITVVLNLFCFSFSFAQTTLHVPAQYSTIQSAINAAVNGDTILVNPGFYSEQINLSTKKIILSSLFLLSNDTIVINETIINGNSIDPVITINSGAKVIGFTIQNGGISGIQINNYNNNDSPTIQNCKVKNNLGFGIELSYSSAQILGCEISYNASSGIYEFSASGLISGCKIFNNLGGGINYFSNNANLRKIINCLIYNNQGNAINNRYRNPAEIINTTIMNNNNGIICVEGSEFTIKNSIFYNTGNPITLTNHVGIHILNIDYSIIENGQNGIINNSNTALINYGNNNINFNPMVINIANYNLKLSEYSPAIGSGTSLGSPEFDIEGNIRPSPSGSNPDIGAYESPLAHFNLLPPVLSSVPNGVIHQLTNLQLKWNPVYAAASYRFQFSTDSTFQTTLIDQLNITDTFYNISSLNYLTKYYWRVNASYPHDTSDWSEVWNFTTIIEAPETPILLAPADNSYNNTIDVSFSWNSSLRAEKYEFQLARDTLFQNIILIDSSIVGTTRVVTGLNYNSKYFWRVSAINIGGKSSYSTVWNLRTKLQSPSLQSPANGSQNAPITPTLSWASVNGAVNYQLQISLDSLFNQIVLNDSIIINTFIQVGPLLNNTKYYWRVRGYNGIYYSDFSEFYNFTTIISNPNSPQLLSPSDGSVNQPLDITFAWEPVTTATSYTLQISIDSLFSSIIINDSSITTTSKTVNLPNYNQKYFWRVRAKNIGGYSNYSSKWNLITLLPAPYLSSINPMNKEIQINWNQSPIPNLLMNNIYRDVTPNPTQLISSVPFNQTSFIDTGLTNGITYYYRIKTVSIFGVESDFSNQLSTAPFNSPPYAITLNPVFLPNEGRVLRKEISFSSTGSNDPDGSIDSIRWYVNDEFINYGNTLTYQFPQGTNIVKLIVIDNDGGSDTSITTVTRTMFRNIVNGQVLAGLSLIGNNTLYAIVNDDAIYKMDKEGNIDYTLQVGGNLLASSSIANDSTVYLGSTDNNIYAFTKNGTNLWVRPLGGEITSTPTIDILNDRVYVGVSNRNFQFLDRSNGSVLGNYFSDSPINTSAVITTDNKLFFSTIKGTMYGFDLTNITFPNVTPTWIITSDDTISSSPAIDEEGFFYVGTKNGLLKKISMHPGLQGTVVWQANLGGSIFASPVIDGRGNVYIGSSNSKFFSINKNNGNINWSYDFDGPIKATAAVSDLSTIYFGTENGYVYAIDTMGTRLWQYIDSSAICASLLYANNTLYFGTHMGRLIALYDNDDLSKNSFNKKNIWGTFQGNNQRTGEQTDRLTNIIDNKNYSPIEYALYDNFPNPFNPSTIIRYSLPYQSKVKIEIYNIVGEMVKELIDQEQASGFYEVTFNAVGLSSGIYLLRLTAQSSDYKNTFSKVMKMILMK